MNIKGIKIGMSVQHNNVKKKMFDNISTIFTNTKDRMKEYNEKTKKYQEKLIDLILTQNTENVECKIKEISSCVYFLIEMKLWLHKNRSFNSDDIFFIHNEYNNFLIIPKEIREKILDDIKEQFDEEVKYRSENDEYEDYSETSIIV